MRIRTNALAPPPQRTFALAFPYIRLRLSVHPPLRQCPHALAFAYMRIRTNELAHQPQRTFAYAFA